MKILVCGDRRWSNYNVMWHRLYPYRIIKDTVIIHGGAPGADTMADDIAKQILINILVFPADWNLYGLGAGPRRNTEMLRENPDLILAFHNNISDSKGTKDLVTQALRLTKIPIEIIREETGAHPWIRNK